MVRRRPSTMQKTETSLSISYYNFPNTPVAPGGSVWWLKVSFSYHNFQKIIIAQCSPESAQGVVWSNFVFIQGSVLRSDQAAQGLQLVTFCKLPRMKPAQPLWAECHCQTALRQSGEIVPPYIQSELLPFHFMFIVTDPPALRCCEESGSISSKTFL